MTEPTKVQNKPGEGKPDSELHAENKPTGGPNAPEGNKDRTAEQFDKLTEKNREMSEKLKAFETQAEAESVLESLKPKSQAPQVPKGQNNPYIPPTPKGPAKKKLIDDQTGYVNADVLESSLDSANQRAIKAEQQSQDMRKQFVKYEETQQTRAAHNAHPELDPHSDKFDENYFKLVRNELIGQMMNGEKDVLKAAANVKKFYTPKVVEEKKAEPKEDPKDQKQQINAGQTRSGQVDTYKDVQDSELVMATRKNKKGALAERLKRAGY